jgi:hypothetical protein
MTRKDFQLIADVIKQMGPEDIKTKGKIALCFAEALKYTNVNFKAERFYNAAVPQEER